jgi:hypothetical protein
MTTQFKFGRKLFCHLFLDTVLSVKASDNEIPRRAVIRATSIVL